MLGFSREEKIKRRIHTAVHTVESWKKNGISIKAWTDLVELPKMIGEIIERIGLEMTSARREDFKQLSGEIDIWEQYQDEVKLVIKQLLSGPLTIKE